MKTEALVGLLQFADGLFPAGGYAHSFGLETSVQEGFVTDAGGVLGFLRVLLESATGPADAVAVAAGVRAARAGALDAAFEIDETLDALKPAVELREASRQMGRQTLRVAARLHPAAAVARLFRAVEARETPGHHPLAFAFAMQAKGAEPPAATAAYLYATAAAVVGAGLRLLPIGQLEGQRMLHEVGPTIARLADEAAGKGMSDVWSFNPATEIAAMRHARLDARLFRS